jgi:hypothetical protein
MFLLAVILSAVATLAHGQSTQMNARYASACVGAAGRLRAVTVFTDIDDTLKSPARAYRAINAGFDYAWARNREKTNIVYPGMPAFEAMLAKGPAGTHAGDERGVVVLSARPEELQTSSDLSSNAIGVEMRRLGGLGLREMLLGKLFNSLQPSETVRYQKFADEKANDAFSFLARKAVAAEGNCNFFVGDDGQGDVVAGVQMLTRERSFAGVFIHAIDFAEDDEDEHPKLKPASLPLAGQIHWFRTAVGAALQAHCGMMMSRAALRIVVADVRRSDQRKSCLQTCKPDSCVPFTTKCSDENCGADPKTGFAPGCSELLCELKLADDFLAGRQTCAQIVPQVDAAPAYLGAGRSNVAPQCGTVPAMALYETGQTSDSALLADPRASAAVLTPEETAALLKLPQPATECIALSGACLDSSALTCPAGFIDGLCPRLPANVKCCPTQKPVSAVVGKPCKNNFGGAGARCLDRSTTKCASAFVRGQCPDSPANVMCCPKPFTTSSSAQLREDDVESDVADDVPLSMSSSAVAVSLSSLVALLSFALHQE